MCGRGFDSVPTMMISVKDVLYFHQDVNIEDEEINVAFWPFCKQIDREYDKFNFGQFHCYLKENALKFFHKNKEGIEEERNVSLVK